MDILAFLRERAGAFRCPMCRRSLADCKLRQLDHEGSRYKVEVTCRNCELAFLVALELAGGDEAEGLEVEEGAVAPVEPISDEDLLQVHQALGRLSGPLTQLLRDRDAG